MRYATYGIETCCSYLGSIKHTYISMVKQTVSTSYIPLWSFSCFFLLRGAQCRILNNNNNNDNNNNNNSILKKERHLRNMSKIKLKINFVKLNV